MYCSSRMQSDHIQFSVCLMHAFSTLAIVPIKTLSSWHPCPDNEPSVCPPTGQMHRMLMA